MERKVSKKSEILLQPFPKPFNTDITSDFDCHTLPLLFHSLDFLSRYHSLHEESVIFMRNLNNIEAQNAKNTGTNYNFCLSIHEVKLNIEHLYFNDAFSILQ